MTNRLRAGAAPLLRLATLALGCVVVSGCELAYGLSLAVTCSVGRNLTLDPAELPDAVLDREYRQTVAVRGYQLIYRIALDQGELPPGLELIHADRDPHALIQGVPTQPGVYEFTVRGSGMGTQCAGPEGFRSYRITVSDGRSL